jgi:hypothetical protein
MATIKVSHEELEFMAKHLPAFGTLGSSEIPLYLHIMQLLASIPKVVTFIFPREHNHVMGKAVACIKMIRTFTGWGLKEAKDAYDAEHPFNLSDAKMTKEQVLTACNLDGINVKFN